MVVKLRLRRAVRPPEVPETTGRAPHNLLASALNLGSVRRSRRKVDGDIRVHVSDLTKFDPRSRFCPREFVLHWHERKEYVGAGVTPGFELLFASGHAIHDHVRNLFLRRSRHRAAAWGVWKCACRRMSVEGHAPDPANVCRYCRTPADAYHEVSLLSNRYKIVGHPDFLIKWGDWFYIYEIKTIDRVDVDFDAMHAPLGDHTLQGSFYYWLMCGRGMPVSPLVRYLYVDRSSRKLYAGLPYREFEVMRSGRERIAPFLEKAATVLRSVEELTLPPRICDSVTCARAKNCRVSLSCFERRSSALQPRTASPGSTSP